MCTHPVVFLWDLDCTACALGLTEDDIAEWQRFHNRLSADQLVDWLPRVRMWASAYTRGERVDAQ